MARPRSLDPSDVPTGRRRHLPDGRARSGRRARTAVAALGVATAALLSAAAVLLASGGSPSSPAHEVALSAWTPHADVTLQKGTATPRMASPVPVPKPAPAPGPRRTAPATRVARPARAASGGHGVQLIVSVAPVGGGTAGDLQTRARALAEIDQARSFGAAGIRINVDVRWLCPSTTCDTEPLAPLVEHADALGMKVVVHVNSMPSWLDGRGRWFGPSGATADRWAQLFAQFPARFGTAVDGYEVWNEPNVQEFWQQGPDAGQYADLLKAVWTRTKAVAPHAQLIGGMLSNNDLGYMHRLSAALKARGGTRSNHFFYDMLGVHPYTGGAGVGFDPALPAGSRAVQTTTGEKNMTFRGVERVRAQVAADEGIWRNVVIGEFGYDTQPGQWYYSPEPQRSAYLTSALTISSTWSWMKGMTVYGWTRSSDDGFRVTGTASEAAIRALTAR